MESSPGFLCAHSALFLLPACPGLGPGLTMMQAAEEGWACDEVAKWRVKPFATAQAEAAVMETALLHLSSPTALLEAAPRVWTENRRSPWATLYLRGMQSRLAALSRMYHAAEPQAVSVQDLAMLKTSSAKVR